MNFLIFGEITCSKVAFEHVAIVSGIFFRGHHVHVVLCNVALPFSKKNPSYLGQRLGVLGMSLGLGRPGLQWLLETTFAFLSVALDCHPRSMWHRNAIFEFLFVWKSHKKWHGDASNFPRSDRSGFVWLSAFWDDNTYLAPLSVA